MLTLPKRCLLERTADAKDLPIPARQTPHAAGVDLHAKITAPVTISRGECVLIPTGIKIALPVGFEAQVRSRSGLALNHGVVVLNSPGTVDADYRGEVKVLLINHGIEDFVINRGDRIAQMVISKVEVPDFNEVEKLPESARGEGGYGSTGIEAAGRGGGFNKNAFEEFRRMRATEKTADKSND